MSKSYVNLKQNLQKLNSLNKEKNNVSLFLLPPKNKKVLTIFFRKLSFHVWCNLYFCLHPSCATAILTPGSFTGLPTALLPALKVSNKIFHISEYYNTNKIFRISALRNTNKLKRGNQNVLCFLLYFYIGNGIFCYNCIAFGLEWWHVYWSIHDTPTLSKVAGCVLHVLITEFCS